LTYKSMLINVPYSILSINNEYFITGNNGIYKTDKYFNLVDSYISTGASYTSIYYNSTSDILYVVVQYSSRIDLFYRNLTFISSISLTSLSYALTEKNGKIYVGLDDGSISVIENNLVVNSITTLCNGWITSIVIDSNDLMGVLCWSNSMLYLYSTNGSYTGNNMATPSSPRYVNYDLNGHFIIGGESQINVYY
jgi:hypothetical protein